MTGSEVSTGTAVSIGTRRALRPYVALAVLAGAVTALVSRFAFPDGTLDLDEVSYRAQANALRAHHLTLARATFDPFFRPFLTGVRGDRVVFKYQPVWPALLAASDAVFHSTLPLRMLLSAAGVLAVTWFARELVRDRRVAIIAGCLALASPFTWVQSASLLGYQLSLVLGTAAGAGLLRSLRTKSRGPAIGAGALLGLAVLHRPFDAVLAAAPVLVYAAWRSAREHRLARLAGFVGVGGAPFAILFLAYNRAVMGSALRLPFGVTGNVDRFGFGWRASFTVAGNTHDGQVHYTIGLAISTLGRVLAAFPRFLVAAPIVLMLAGSIVWLRRRDARVWLLVAMVATPVVGYLFWWGTANAFQFHLERALGPFYHYLLLPPLCVAAAWGASVWRPSRRVWIGFGVVAVAWTAVFSVIVGRDARSMGRARTADVATTLAPGRHLTLEAPTFAGDPYLRFANDAGLHGVALAAVDIPGRRFEVVGRFPGRALYAARSFHRAGEPFGPEVRDRVRLSVVRGTAARLHLRALVPRGSAATSYLRIGDESRVFASSGASRVDQSWTLHRADLERALAGARSGATVWLTAGITLDGGSVPPAAMTPEFYECRFEARLVASALEILTPCDGFRGYLFPNDAQAIVAEDVSPVIRLDAHVATH